MKPIGVTIGDAAGVGLELLLRLVAQGRAPGPFLLYGSVGVVRSAAASLRARGLPAPDPERIVAAGSAGAGRGSDGIEVVDVAGTQHAAAEAHPWGRSVPAFGALQHAALVRAVADARAGRLDAIVTLPWHKALLAEAGLPPTGHTEVLQELGGVDRVLMVLAGDVLRVALATTHLPLRDVPDAIDTAGLVETGRLFAHGLTRDWGMDNPRIAFCGLNPHAGESGTMGTEDARIIAPAVAQLRAAGIDAVGPVPADTLFPLVVHGRMRADGVVAMYHDQGLGPLKMWHFGESANVTFGLPFVRTSPDHGTARDIAGQGTADDGGLCHAWALARSIAARRASAQMPGPR